MPHESSSGAMSEVSILSSRGGGSQSPSEHTSCLEDMAHLSSLTKCFLCQSWFFLSKTFYFHSIMPILWWHSSFSLFITATAVLASLMPGMLSVLEFPFFLSSIFTIKHLKCFYCDVQGFHAKILDLCSLLRIFTSLLVTLIRYICWVWKPPTTLHPGYWTARESA